MSVFVIVLSMMYVLWPTYLIISIIDYTYSSLLGTYIDKYIGPKITGPQHWRHYSVSKKLESCYIFK